MVQATSNTSFSLLQIFPNGRADHMYTSTNPGQTQPSFWLAKLDSSGLQGVKKQVQALVSGVIASAM